MPRSLSGGEGPAARAAAAEISALTSVVGVPVETYDERFTTVTANRALADSGVRGQARRQVVDKVAAESGLSKKDAGTAVDAVISTIESALKGGDEVSFTGFGKFHVTRRAARQGVNPRTGEPVQIAAANVPKFSAGSSLKKAVN